MKHQDILKEYMKDLDIEDFRNLVIETHQQLFPAWTDEELLFHPDEAKQLCVAIRQKLLAKKIPDHFILRVLVNARKNPR